MSKPKIKTYLPHDDAEAQGLHDGAITRLVIPMDPQPVDGKVWYEKDWPGGPAFVSSPLDTVRMVWKMPYQPGDRIAVKERWAECECGNCTGYVYASELGWNCRTPKEQHPAKSMPLKAVRTYLVCRSVGCQSIDGVSNWIVEVWRE